MAANNLGVGVKDFTNQLSRAIKKASTGKELEIIGRITAETIVRRTRDGYGVKGGAKVKLARLSDKYIKFRRRNARRLSAFTSPGKSNLTFSGSMLSDLTVRRVTGAVVLTFRSAKNKKKAGYVSKARPFFLLTKEERKAIAEKFERNFLRVVKKRK